ERRRVGYGTGGSRPLPEMPRKSVSSAGGLPSLPRLRLLDVRLGERIMGGNTQAGQSVSFAPHRRGALTEPRDPGFANLNNVRIGQTSRGSLRAPVRSALEVIVGARRLRQLWRAVVF